MASSPLTETHGHGAHHHPALAHQFDSLEQQKESSTLGMWLFLVTEVMFFGGLFLAYVIYRGRYPEAFLAGSNTLDVLLGGLNTAVLIASSWTMVLAIWAAQVNWRKGIVLFLILTMILGSVFLVVKAFEYAEKFEHHHVPGASFQFEGAQPQHAEIFFSLYFIMTGLHATHMVIGIAILAVLAVLAWRGHYGPDYYNPLEMTGLYWHFVDLVWIFLFPLLYLLGAHVH
ncbi:MAG TPA: cytochrome c oxidase subunit 3 family protein [Thermoanaerobaculia bacterium]